MLPRIPTPEEPSPEYSVDEIIKSLREREEWRRYALDEAWRRLEEAETEQDRGLALHNVARMIGVLEAYRAKFPEVFPAEGDEVE